MALPSKSPVNQVDEGWQPPASLAADVAARALPPKPDGWQSYLGDYLSINLDTFVNPTSTLSRVYEQSGSLHFDWAEPNENDTGQYRLYEVAPGLFFTETGQALDFRSTPPTYRNIELKKVDPGPSTLAWGVLTACGLVMFSILLVLPLKSIWGRIRLRGSETCSGIPRIPAAAVSNVLTIVTSLFGLASIGMLAVIPRLIYSGFLGWLPLPIWQKLLFHAPLGLAVYTLALTALDMLAWRQRWRYAALGRVSSG